MKLIIILAALSINTFIIYSQKTSVTTFKISATNISIFPREQFVYVGLENRIKVSCKPKGIPFSCKVSNGKLKKINDSVFVISSPLPIQTLLSIYQVDSKGKEHVISTKIYDFIPFPIVRFMGIKSDSATNRMGLAMGNFQIEYQGKKKIPVKSFKIEIYNNNKIYADRTLGNRLSKKMLHETYKLRPGMVVTFSDFTYQAPDGSIQTEPFFRMFIIADDPNPINFDL